MKTNKNKYHHEKKLQRMKAKVRSQKFVMMKWIMI